MKVVAFNGSPRKNGNTMAGLRIVMETLEKHGIETEIIQVGGKPLRGCIDCRTCKLKKDLKCAINTDELNDYIPKVVEADGIIIGSPVYYSSMTAETKALIDRLGYVISAAGPILHRKVGAAVVAVRRAGSNLTFAEINMMFGINGMYTVGSTYWNMIHARDLGEWEQDEEGIQTMIDLGENMAYLLEKLNA